MKAGEIRAILGVGQKTIRTLVKTGRLRFVQASSGGKRLYLREDLEHFLSQPTGGQP
jgi:excisionase family DNA binding protein